MQTHVPAGSRLHSTLYIALEIAPSCTQLDSLEDYFLQNCSSSSLTLCKSHTTKIAHHEMRVPKK